MNIVFYTFFYRPCFNLIVFLTKFLPGHDLGLAVIVFAVLLRILLHPFFKEQKKLESLRGEIEKIQKKFKNNKEQLTKEILALYQRERVSPLSSFIFLGLQLAIAFAFFLVVSELKDGLSQLEMKKLYSFVSPPPFLSPFFLGFIDLSAPFLILKEGVRFYWPTFVLVLLNLILNIFLAQRMPLKSSPLSFQKQFFYFSLFFTFFLPSIFVLYWLVNTFLGLLFQEIEKYGRKNPKSQTNN